MQLETLQILWYLVVAVAMIMYTILDGFDLGVGALHLFAKNDNDRRIFLNAIGPVWDGNEVWLVIILGALFAGFPLAYGTVLSGFYTLMMILIPGLMLRAAAIEFRSKRESKSWRHFWDFIFFFSSVIVAFIFGMGLGNFISGVPLDQNQVYIGGFTGLFHPYALLVGFLGLSLFMMHGGIYLVMKTEGDLHRRMRVISNLCIALFIALFFVTTIYTFITMPHMLDRFFNYPLLFIIPFLMLIVILSVPYHMRRGNDGWAFISSSLSIALLLITFGMGTYPYLLKSTIDPLESSLTITNASSSAKTLGILLVIVLIGVPLVLAYGYWIYFIFRGKVKLDERSY